MFPLFFICIKFMITIFNFILFTLALFISLMIISYKISAIVRVFKFGQEETQKEAYIVTLMLLIVSILWGLIFTINID